MQELYYPYRYFSFNHFEKVTKIACNYHVVSVSNVFRYEDMKKDPCKEIRNVADFLCISTDDATIKTIADESSFKRYH